MQELLEAVQMQLRADLDDIRDGDIYITPHLNFIPADVRPPCIGIKDGAVRRKELAGEMLQVFRDVRLAIFVKLLKPEAALMGDSAALKKGVLQIAEDIHASLDENLLGIDGMHDAFSSAEAESEMFGDGKDGLQRKIVTYTYEKEESRP